MNSKFIKKVSVLNVFNLDITLVFKLHRIHETIATDNRVVRLSASVSVCLSRDSTRFRCAKTAKRINIVFGVNTFGGPWNIVLDGVQIAPLRGGGRVGENFAYCGHVIYFYISFKSTFKLLRPPMPTYLKNG